MAIDFSTNTPVILKGRAARRFADAVERSMNAPPMDYKVNFRELHGEELKEFLRKTLEEHEKR